jgi:hypothetical protein
MLRLGHWGLQLTGCRQFRHSLLPQEHAVAALVLHDQVSANNVKAYASGCRHPDLSASAESDRYGQ